MKKSPSKSHATVPIRSKELEQAARENRRCKSYREKLKDAATPRAWS